MVRAQFSFPQACLLRAKQLASSVVTAIEIILLKSAELEICGQVLE
jgi:hypothetical protein